MKDIEAELLYGRVYQMGKAIRFAIVVIVITICMSPLLSSLMIPSMMNMYSEMGTAELPIFSRIIFQGKYFFMGFSGLLPLLAIGTMVMRNLTASFYLLGIIAFIASIYGAIVLLACYLPLFRIINIMGVQ